MKSVKHWLVGYNRRTEFGEVEVPIPAGIFSEVANFVRFDEDDPEVVGCYEITGGQAERIIQMIGKPPASLAAKLSGLDFFIEGSD